MKKGIVLGLVIILLATSQTFAEGLDVYHLNPPPEDVSSQKKHQNTLPYEKPDPVISPTPTTQISTQETITVSPTPAPRDPAEPVELKAAPGPINPNIPCELQMPWENGAPLPCPTKKQPVISIVPQEVTPSQNISSPATESKHIKAENVSEVKKTSSLASPSATTKAKKIDDSSVKNSQSSPWSFFKKIFSFIFNS